jgi:hypothetical protein
MTNEESNNCLVQNWFQVFEEQLQQIRPRILLTQLVELNFRELLDSTLMKVVIDYITRECYITSFVERVFDDNNEFLTKIMSIKLVL